MKAIILVILTCCLPFYALSMGYEEELKSRLETMQEEHKIPAVSLSVILNGKVFYIDGFGQTTLNKQVTPKTRFRIASISKLFTAQAIMQLAEQGKINLNDPLGLHLPQYKGSGINIIDLLTHTSGIQDSIRPVSINEGRTHANYVAAVKASLQRKDSVQKFNYSDTGFNLLGSVIQQVSGIPFEDYARQHILTPSAMANSGYFNERPSAYSDTQPTYDGEELATNQRRPYDPAFNPSEGLISSVEDLSKWLALVLNKETSLLKTNSYLAMITPMKKTTWGQIQMGLGWQVCVKDNEFVARHPGSIRGFKSLVITYPEKKNAIILLTNSSNTPRMEIAKAVKQILKRHSLW